MDENAFDENYSQMLDGELARLLRSRRTLVLAAQNALDREIQKRQLDPEKLRKQKPQYFEKNRKPTIAEKRLKNKRLRWPAMLLIMATSILLIFMLDHFDKALYFWPILITISVPAFVVWGFDELLRRRWFWGILAAVFVGNMILFTIVQWPWGTHWVPATTIQGLCTLELIPICVLIDRTEKRINSRSKDIPPQTKPKS